MNMWFTSNWYCAFVGDSAGAIGLGNDAAAFVFDALLRGHKGRAFLPASWVVNAALGA